MWLGVIVVGVVVPLVAALWAKKKQSVSVWKACAVVVLVCAIVGAVCMRVVFYNLGLSLFALF